ncbi:acetyltransferase [Paenibacillus sp. J31TS4]|uniref:GNAT family N-acetyltransferase n=1 Tax=Paenibacillus sp. J31TS4 TaxID=2807195 RepID=UPI001B022894|nr:GNAT family N-acetyltransferase [Paenibacillus sp. J31TS4]GIP38685.1 acetyltransferase [Paenibacillus sp. J31TS4]
MTDEHVGELTRLWNEEWGETFPMRDRLLVQNVLHDPNVLTAGTRVAIDEDNGQIAGYVVAKLWQDDIGGLDFGRETGWIHSLLVASSYRNRGLGSELLSLAESALRSEGVRHINLGNDFHRRVFPGVPETCDASGWLEKRGYVRQSAVVDLYREYSNEQPVSLPEYANVTFRLLKAEEEEQLNAFMRHCFPGWLYQTLQYWQRGGDGREFVVCEKDGDIIGFCRINDSHSPLLAQNVYWSPLFAEELGGIGPLGIDERYRGLGYGLAIVQAGVHFLQGRNIRHMVIDTTQYVDFYGKLGFRTWRSYMRYRKQV